MRRVPLIAMLAAVAGMAGALPAASGAAVVAPAAAQQSTGAAIFADDAGRDRIVEAIQRKYDARVVKITEIVVAGRRAYALRLLSDGGRVWMVRVDAETGQELSGKE
jgi:uncharacterized membrane protein YkoI